MAPSSKLFVNQFNDIDTLYIKQINTDYNQTDSRYRYIFNLYLNL